MYGGQEDIGGVAFRMHPPREVGARELHCAFLTRCRNNTASSNAPDMAGFRKKLGSNLGLITVYPEAFLSSPTRFQANSRIQLTARPSSHITTSWIDSDADTTSSNNFALRFIPTFQIADVEKIYIHVFTYYYHHTQHRFTISQFYSNLTCFDLHLAIFRVSHIPP